MPPTLAYWPPRGLAGQIRLILHYAGEQFEDKRYSPTLENSDPAAWASQKFNLGLDFPNLPYYIDGDLQITQSIAIERYLARKYNLVATDEKDVAKQDNLLYVASDIQMGLIRLAYGPNFEENKKGYPEKLQENLRMLSTYLRDKDFFVGPKINFVDFHLYEAISINTVFDPECLELFPNLRSFLSRIESLPGVQEYLSSSSYVKGAICGPGASWGYIPAK